MTRLYSMLTLSPYDSRGGFFSLTLLLVRTFTQYKIYRVNCFNLFFQRALYLYSRLSSLTSVFVFFFIAVNHVLSGRRRRRVRDLVVFLATYAWNCRSGVLIITIESALRNLPLTVTDGEFVRTNYCLYYFGFERKCARKLYSDG